MKEDLITFETAKLAKEKGFTDLCLYYFSFFRNYEDEPYIWIEEVDTIERNYNKTVLPVDVHLFGIETISRTTQSLLQKWLRKTHDIHIVLPVDPYSQEIELYSVKVYKDSNGMRCVFTNEDRSKRHQYEEALEIGLQEALNLIS